MNKKPYTCPQCGSANTKRAPTSAYSDRFVLLRRPRICDRCGCIFEPKASPIAAILLILLGLALAVGGLAETVVKLRAGVFGADSLVACIGAVAGVGFAAVGTQYLRTRKARIMQDGSNGSAERQFGAD